MSPKMICRENCEGATQPNGGGGGGSGKGVSRPPPWPGKILHFEPEKTVSDAFILSKDY